MVGRIIPVAHTPSQSWRIRQTLFNLFSSVGHSLSIDLHRMAIFDTPKQIPYLIGGVLLGLWALSRIMRAIRPGSQSTLLRGPPSKSLLFGLSNHIRKYPDSSVLYERWAEEYGSMYSVPTGLGSTRIMLADPKAIASFFAQGTVSYVRPSGSRRLTMNLLCL
jgi:hypothetical protein